MKQGTKTKSKGGEIQTEGGRKERDIPLRKWRKKRTKNSGGETVENDPCRKEIEGRKGREFLSPTILSLKEGAKMMRNNPRKKERKQQSE